MPQVASKDSKGRPYKNRNTVRSKTAPTKAAALRQAQVAMIEGKVKLEGSDLRNSRTSVTLPEALTKNAPKSLSHPFYWSSFSLIGSPW
jgi:CHAT domain-containing protein